jgi:hypothetical protein
MLLEMPTLPDRSRARRYEELARSYSCYRCGRQLVAKTPKLLPTMYRANLRTCRRMG